MNTDEIANAALLLPEDERWKLLRQLLDSVEPGEDLSQAEWAEAWGSEVERRMEEAEGDPTVLVPGELVFAELRKKHGPVR